MKSYNNNKTIAGWRQQEAAKHLAVMEKAADMTIISLEVLEALELAKK